VFGHSLRGTFLLLMTSLLAPTAAHAVLDLTSATLVIRIERTTVGDDSFTASLRVVGEDMDSGTFTLPSAPSTPIVLEEDGDDLVWEENYSTEATLNAALSNGTYVLRVNNNDAVASVMYTRPVVPSPLISQPSGVVPPGPIEVLFNECPVCNLVGDSVEAVLEDGLAVELDSETLGPADDSWIPQDLGGDLELPEDSEFVVRITHTAVRQANIPADDIDDNVLFTASIINSDEVGFATGFNPPAGHFCLAANFPGPPAGCETLADPALQIFDPSGAFTTQVAGHDVDVALTVEASGALTGSASADLDDSGMNETGPSPLKGKLGGGDGEASSKLSFSLENAGMLAKLKVSITDALSIAGNVRDRLERASGGLNGVKIKEETSSSDSPLPDPPLGWLLEYDLAADGTISNAELTLEGGRNFTLTGSNKFNLAANESSAKLSSDPKGVSVQLKKVGLDDSTDPMQISGGDLGYRALGQSGSVTLP